MLIAWLQDSVPPRARYDGAPGPLGRRGELAARRAARAAAAPRRGPDARAGRAGRARGARGARRADDRPRRRRLVRRRPLGRPAVRPARRRRPLAVLRLARRCDEPLELLGHALADLTLISDRPLALVSVRLCEVLPGGASLLVTRGQLNLTHREGHDRVVPLVPGRAVRGARAARRDRRTASPPARGCASRSRRPTGRSPGPRRRPVTLGVVAGESSIALPLHDAAGRAGRARAVPARGAAGVPDDRARARARRAHDHARARQRPHRAALRLGSRRHEPRRRDRHRDHVRGRRGLRDRRGRSALGARRVHERDGAAARGRRLGRALGDAHRDDVRRRALPDRVARCACSTAARRRSRARGRSRSRATAASATRARAARRARSGGAPPAGASSARELGRAVRERRAQRHLLEEPRERERDDARSPCPTGTRRAARARRPRGTRRASPAAAARPRRG